MRRAGIVLLVALAGCGSSGLEGTLQWRADPRIRANGSAGGASATGVVHNTTSHSVSLDPKRMRLLDDHGRKVTGRIRVGQPELGAGSSTLLTARWKSGKPVRIDYGAGTLALPSS
jgi:hypothetical protein